jgi:hypothetical protein
MRHMPIRYTPVGYTPIRHPPIRCTLVGCMPVRYVLVFENSFVALEIFDFEPNESTVHRMAHASPGLSTTGSEFLGSS